MSIPEVLASRQLLIFLDGPSKGVTTPPVKGWDPATVDSCIECNAPDRVLEYLYVRVDDRTYRLADEPPSVGWRADWMDAP